MQAWCCEYLRSTASSVFEAAVGVSTSAQHKLSSQHTSHSRQQATRPAPGSSSGAKVQANKCSGHRTRAAGHLRLVAAHLRRLTKPRPPTPRARTGLGRRAPPRQRACQYKRCQQRRACLRPLAPLQRRRPARCHAGRRLRIRCQPRLLACGLHASPQRRCSPAPGRLLHSGAALRDQLVRCAATALPHRWPAAWPASRSLGCLFAQGVRARLVESAQSPQPMRSGLGAERAARREAGRRRAAGARCAGAPVPAAGSACTHSTHCWTCACTLYPTPLTRSPCSRLGPHVQHTLSDARVQNTRPLKLSHVCCGVQRPPSRHSWRAPTDKQCRTGHTARPFVQRGTVDKQELSMRLTTSTQHAPAEKAADRRSQQQAATSARSAAGRAATPSAAQTRASSAAAADGAGRRKGRCRSRALASASGSVASLVTSTMGRCASQLVPQRARGVCNSVHEPRQLWRGGGVQPGRGCGGLPVGAPWTPR